MPGMIDTIKNAFKIPDLRKKLLLTLGLLIVFRIGCAVPVPGIDISAFSRLVDSLGDIGNLFDAISGGALRQVSIFSMSITPYINASIIMQLLTVVIPSLERLQKEGEEGRKKIMQYVRYATIVLGLLEAAALWYGARSAQSGVLPEVLNAILIIFSFTAGTTFIMWLGEQINEFGIGNGISLMIFAGIVSRGPAGAQALVAYFQNWTLSYNVLVAAALIILVVVAFVAIIAGVIFVQLAERRITVQYAKRVVGRKMYGGQSTYLPIKVNMAGVIPIIFAMSIMTLPATIISFFFANDTSPFIVWLKSATSQSVGYYVIYALMIFGFTFFYSMIQFNPVEVSNNLQKNGGFIPGYRPGRPTAEYISRVSNRLTWFNGIFLALVTLLPVVLGGVTKASGLWFGGTAVLILVGVAIDLVNQLESQMLMRHYKGFLD
jgi:preprotein translocase subunit SecY